MSLTLNSYGTGYDDSDFESELYFDPDNIYTWLASPHPKRGDIQISLTSPHGTTSILLPYRLYDFVNEEGYDNWPFMSVHHWGEDPVGTWTLTVSYRSSSGYVSMSGLSMDIYGTAVTPPTVAGIPTTCDLACSGRCSGAGQQNCDVCRHMRVAATRDCVSYCPHGTHAYKSYCLNGTVLQPDHSTPFSTYGTPYDIGFTPFHGSSSGSKTGITAGSIAGGVILFILIVSAIITVAMVIYYHYRKRSSGMVNFMPLRSDSEPAAV
jgi:hypothetical protein